MLNFFNFSNFDFNCSSLIDKSIKLIYTCITETGIWDRLLIVFAIPIFMIRTEVQLYLHIHSLNYMLGKLQFNFVDIFF